MPHVETEAFFQAYRLHLEFGRKSVEQWYAAAEALVPVREQFGAGEGKHGPHWERWLRFHRIAERTARRMLFVAREGKTANLADFSSVAALVEWCRDQADQRRQRAAKVAHAQQQQAWHAAQTKEERAEVEVCGKAAAAELKVAEQAIETRAAAREAADADDVSEWKVSGRSEPAAQSNEWVTPQALVSAVRNVLGNIDLDPASSALANARVQATL